MAVLVLMQEKEISFYKVKRCRENCFKMRFEIWEERQPMYIIEYEKYFQNILRNINHHMKIFYGMESFLGHIYLNKLKGILEIYMLKKFF